VLQPEKQQPAAVGLSYPSAPWGSAAEGGRRSECGHGCGKGRGEKSLERIHATLCFSIFSQLAVCL